MMTEAEELKKFKKKLDQKYGKLAKDRLKILSKKLNLRTPVIDMSDAEFEEFVALMVSYRQLYQSQTRPARPDQS